MTNGESLLGTNAQPALYSYRRLSAIEAQAYHELVPYPTYGMFKEWKESERGPLPKCRPLPRELALTQAKWLFGKTPKILVENPEIQKFIDAVCQENRFDDLLYTWATRAFYDGGASFAWGYDPDVAEATGGTGVQVKGYSVSHHSRFYYDPHDIRRLLMVRLQYVYWDASTGMGEWMIRRRDITENKIQTYEDLPLKAIWSGAWLGTYSPAVMQLIDLHDKWQLGPTEDNPSGVLPISEVKSVDTGQVYGEGDLWKYYRLIDVLNLTHTIEGIDNQISAWPHRIYIDVRAEDGEEPQAVGPDAAEILRSVGERQGRVQLLESAGHTREHIQAFCKTLEKEIRSVVGYPEIGPEEITNKGNLTAAVMRQVYAPHIRTTDEKRRLWTEQLLEPFFRKMMVGLYNSKHPDVLKFKKLDDLQVTVQWPSYFNESADELSSFVELQGRMVELGYTTQERAIKSIATLNGVEDLNDLLKELPKDAPAKEIENDKAENSPKGTGSGSSGEAKGSSGEEDQD